jgi:hypothetical protein
MICYKDRTFCCDAECINQECWRYFGHQQQKDAEEWWGGPEAPVAFADFSGECGKKITVIHDVGSDDD